MQIGPEHFTGKGIFLLVFWQTGIPCNLQIELLSNILTVKRNRLRGFAGNCRGRRILIEKVVDDFSMHVFFPYEIRIHFGVNDKATSFILAGLIVREALQRWVFPTVRTLNLYRNLIQQQMNCETALNHPHGTSPVNLSVRLMGWNGNWKLFHNFVETNQKLRPHIKRKYQIYCRTEITRCFVSKTRILQSRQPLCEQIYVAFPFQQTYFTNFSCSQFPEQHKHFILSRRHKNKLNLGRTFRCNGEELHLVFICSCCTVQNIR